MKLEFFKSSVTMAAGYSGYPQMQSELVDSENSNPSDDDYSEGTTPSTSTDDDYEPIWIDNVGIRGDLLYVEPMAANNEPVHKHNYESKLPETPKEIPKSKAKAAGKLRMWIKRRKKKMEKTFGEESLEKGSNSASNSLAPKVTFKLSENGAVKTIWLDVDAGHHNYGRRATLSEKLFGLLLTPFSHSPSGNGELDERVMVSALMPHGEAAKEGSIKVGDWLKSIDDIEVTFSNLNNVLSRIISPKKVKLVVQRFGGEENVSNIQFKNSCCLIKQLVGDLHTLAQSKLECAHILHAVYYLSLKTEYVGEGKDNVVYKFPGTESPLYELKGMFITLAHMISDVASPPVLSCTILVKEQTVHAGFIMEGEEIMVFLLPNSCAVLAEVQHFAMTISKLLKLQFRTLSQAFCDPDNKDYLDNFFTQYLHRLLSPLVSKPASSHTVQSTSHLSDILPSVHWFPLSPDVKILVDDILSQFESAGFGDTSEGFYGIRRMFNILGSCFFYKGCLLGSHMDKEDLLDLHLFLQAHGLLSLSETQAFFRAIVWKEIFPSRKQNNNLSSDSGFEEADGRYFLLLVASKHSILGTILEAGGCALSVTGYASPEPFYVELVENTLLLFEDSGIFSSVNRSMENQAPDVACPAMFLKGEKTSWDIISSIVGITAHGHHTSNKLSKRSRSYSNLASEGNKKNPDVSFGLKKFGERDTERQQLLSNMGPADGESDVETNAVSDDAHHSRHSRRRSVSTSSNTGSHESEENAHSNGSMMKRIFSSSYDLRSVHSSHDHINAFKDECCKLVTGCENTLFYYLHMDPVEGVFLAPVLQTQKSLHGVVGKELIQNFERCCLNMRSTFERSLRNKELSLNAVMPKFGLNPFLQAVEEQGALFQCKTFDECRKTQLVLDYWVVGRLFFAPEPREVYVCYHDSAEQNVVELAFRLGFGLLL